MLQRLIRSSLFLTAFGCELRNARWDKTFKPLDVGPDGSCSINEGNKSGEQKIGVEEARGWGGRRRMTRDHNFNRLAPTRGQTTKRFPRRNPGSWSRSRQSHSAEARYTHAWRRPGRRGGIPKRMRWLYRLDPRQENSLPALKRSKPAGCPQAVPARKVEKRYPGFGLPAPAPAPAPRQYQS